MENTILLVDDEAGIRKVLAIALEDSGYEVYAAENGLEALEVFRKIAPSIVLTDIKMPDMDGIELLRRLKELNPETEVIMFTGHGDMDLAIKSLKYDATDFVTKPIHNEVLEIALKRARERIALRAQLRQYTENLEQMVEEKTRRLLEAERMAAVGQIVTELSHAIKNIANGLKGSIFVLNKGIELDNKQYLRQGWRMAADNVERIKNMSLDLLAYGKYAAAEFTLGDPNMPVRQVFELLASKAQQMGVDLQLELDEQLPQMALDAEGIYRCLLNLAVNALDACRQDTAGGKEKRVVIRSKKSGPRAVQYQVADTGTGMDAGVQNKIFQSFFSTKGIHGTGIGLMMVKKIVDQHGGSIKVQSKNGAGTTITLKLPSRA